MSFTVTNNNPREYFIFQSKVKGALLRDAGAGGLVTALLNFRLRHDEAAQSGQPGLSHAEFTQYLSDCGADLSEFECQYLCNAFNDEAHKGFIHEPTFVRHLCGMNQRRMHAVLQLWSRLEKDSEGCVAADTLMAAHREAMSTSPVPARTAGFEDTFGASQPKWTTNDGKTAMTMSSSSRSRTAASAADTTRTRDANDGGDDSHEDIRRVSFEELVAFYSGLSQTIARDEAFVVRVLREWASDTPSHPKLNETNREWGPDGDPLAMPGPLYVKDALNQQLGVSTKTYNYSHMQRVHPPREPLPPLDRQNIMTTTMQERMPAYNRDEMNMADPLVTRRGQSS